MKYKKFFQERAKDPEELTQDFLTARYEQYQSYDNGTDWYLSGGCYDYAIALGELFKVKYWIASDDIGHAFHAFVEYRGKFYDINGEYKTKESLIYNGEYYPKGEVQYEEISKNAMRTYVQEMKSVMSLIEELKALL